MLDELLRRAKEGNLKPEDVDRLFTGAKEERAREVEWHQRHGRCQVVAFEGEEAGRAMEELARFEQEVLAARREDEIRRRAAADHLRCRSTAPRRRAPRQTGSAPRATGVRGDAAQAQAADARPGSGPGPPAPEDAPGDPHEDDAEDRAAGGVAVGAWARLPSTRRAVRLACARVVHG